MKIIHDVMVQPSPMPLDRSHTVATMTFSTVAGRSRPKRVNTSDSSSTTILIWSGTVLADLIVSIFVVLMISHLMRREANQSHDCADQRIAMVTTRTPMMRWRLCQRSLFSKSQHLHSVITFCLRWTLIKTFRVILITLASQLDSKLLKFLKILFNLILIF